MRSRKNEKEFRPALRIATRIIRILDPILDPARFK
jgi:hypothetical protein